MPRRKPIPELKTDRFLKLMIPPTFSEENGEIGNAVPFADSPIIVWNDTILIGYRQYQYCLESRKLPKIKTLACRNRFEAAAWTAAYILRKCSVYGEYLVYLIGERYLGIRNAGKMSPTAFSEMSVDDTYDEILQDIRKNRTAEQIAKKFDYSITTIQKYGIFATNIDLIAAKNYVLAKSILEGRIKISHLNLQIVARMSSEEMRSITMRYGIDGARMLGFSPLKQEVHAVSSAGHGAQIGIKEMPDYDPDAEIAGLSFTVPSWNSSLERAYRVADFQHASPAIKTKLYDKLSDLKDTIELFCMQLEEQKENG